MGLINGSLIDSGLSDLAWIEKYQKLEQQLSQLQQENEQLKADYGNKAQVERDILLQQKEELIKWVEEKIKEINPKKLSNSELYKITSDMKMQRYYAYVNVLLKLKESDK